MRVVLAIVGAAFALIVRIIHSPFGRILSSAAAPWRRSAHISSIAVEAVTTPASFSSEKRSRVVT